MVDQAQGTEGGNQQAPPYEPSKDPSRKAKSKDPGWKYGFWPDKNKKDVVQCMLCDKKVHAGIGRLKRHLAGGFTDVEKCPNTTTTIIREMHAFLTNHSRRKAIEVDSEDEPGGRGLRGGDGGEEDEPAGRGPRPAKRKHAQAPTATTMFNPGPPQKVAKSVASMLRRTPEEVVESRHSTTLSQTSLESCLKKNKEDKVRVDEHVADFWYECGLPFNAINSRSWEILCESIGQYGPGYISPSYHDIRVPLLERAKKKTDALRDKHELAWQEYGCTLMSDGWTDNRTRHLINFLVNSPAGTFFLESVDVSSISADAQMLADLLEKKIDQIGRDYVVQVVTDNGSNYKAAGRILMERFPTLYWTPCAAHCLNLMLVDIGKIPQFSSCIAKARKVTTFIYRHGRLLNAMREKTNGRDLVRPAATRFATSFLTLACLWKHSQALKSLFVDDAWSRSKLAEQEAWKACAEIVLSTYFWTSVENCMRASQALLIVLRVVDGDEKPAMPEVTAKMDTARKKIEEALAHKPKLLAQVLKIVDNRWESQMGQKLYGAALFLNPNRFFDIQKDPENRRFCSRLRHMFNEVMWKMVPDEEKHNKISAQADDYERTEGECFSSKLAMAHRTKKNPLLWWCAYGGLAFELQSFAKRVVSLCCSSSGCERNWSTFQFIHTKKRNRLEHQRLNKLVYIQYNRKMANRFQKIRDEGSKGKSSNPLILDEFQWENEWVDKNAEHVHEGVDLTWAQVDEAAGASAGPSRNFRPRSQPKRAHVDGGGTSGHGVNVTGHSRRRRRVDDNDDEPEADNEEEAEQDEAFEPEDDEDIDSESSSPSTHDANDGSTGPTGGDEGQFALDDDLLDD